MIKGVELQNSKAAKAFVCFGVEAPPEFSSGASDWLRDYFAQHPPPKQQALPSQQSAVREVAVAVPIIARAVMIIKRYFIVPPAELK
jgi:hypothetical protein